MPLGLLNVEDRIARFLFAGEVKPAGNGGIIRPRQTVGTDHIGDLRKFADEAAVEQSIAVSEKY